LIDEQIAQIPARFYFFESLRPLSDGQWRSVLRLIDAVKGKRRMGGFALSNWGSVDLLPDDAPLRVKDMRLYVHSFKTKVLGLIPYTVNDEMRFYCVSHEDYMTHGQMAVLQREFMTTLETHAANTVRAVAAAGR
jgi:hypothetical protein